MKPLPPAGSPHRRDMPPSLLSPFSRSAFPAAAADGDNDAAVSEQPSIMLLEWWLATVEGDEQKIAVAGTFRWKQTLHELCPQPIAKCHSPNILESEDGIVLLISGSLNISRTLDNGYSNAVCRHFMAGFPHWWQSCNQHYPKRTNSDTGCQPCSSNTSKHPDGLKSSSRNDSVFPKSSHLSNGTPRFGEHTCDGDIATNENGAALSEAGKGGQRTPVVTLEVRGCSEETEHMAFTEKAAVDEEMPTSVYLDVQNSFSLSNGTPILEEYTCDGDIPTNEDAAASNVDNKIYTAPSKEVNNVEIGLIAGSPSSERGHDDSATDVSLAPTVQCTNNAVSEAVYSTPATDRKKTPVACLKNQGSWGGNQHVASNKKPVGQPKKQISPHEKCQSATRSRGTRSPASYVLWSPLTRGKATSLSMSTPEDLKLKRTRSGRVIVPKLDNGCQSIVYGKDGWIKGVIGLDSPAMPKWSESRTDGRKKRTAGSESRTDGRKKRRTAGSESRTNGRKKRRTAWSKSRTDGRKKRTE